MTTVDSCKDDKNGMDPGKYVRYTPEQVEALERLYHECPKPTSICRQQLIRECAILSNIEPRQIKVWFQNRRCREKQRKEASRLQAVNCKLTAMNKLLMEENDRLQKQVSQLVYENSIFSQKTNNRALAITDTSCESVVTSNQHHLTTQRSLRDASPAGLMSIAEETLAEFLSKATGTAIEWIQMPGVKPGPDSFGIIAISHGCTGVAARACGLVSLEPMKVAEILKNRQLWYRDCRAVDVIQMMSSSSGGTIELLYMQLYAPTTLAPPRDFWCLHYTKMLEDGTLVICERSLGSMQGGASMEQVRNFVRAEMLPSGFLIRPCEGGGSVVHIVHHMDLDPWSVPEVLRHLYESSTVLAQRTTIAAIRHLRQIAEETSHPSAGWDRQPAALRTLSQRLSRGFNEAINGFTDEGWSVLGDDVKDDIIVMLNSSASKTMGLNPCFTNGLPFTSTFIVCAKASMLLSNVSPALLLRFLREHRSEWADSSIDTYNASAVKDAPWNLPCSFVGGFDGQVILPLVHTTEHEEFLEVLKLENTSRYDDPNTPRDLFFLQLCSGMDESATGTFSELVFAPIDASFADDAPLLPSGFRVIPLDTLPDSSSPNRTLDLASSLEIGSVGNKVTANCYGNSGNMRSVMTLVFQFAFESQFQEKIALMARQYVRSIISSVQRIVLALSPSRLSLGPLPGPETLTLVRWITQGYRFHSGVELCKSANQDNMSVLTSFWQHSDAIICCSLKANPTLTFANQAGLDMLETTFVALHDISIDKIFALLNISIDKIFNDQGKKMLCMDSPQIMQQGFACLEGGTCMSSMGRPVSYESAVAWKVMNEENNPHCICFMFLNWSFI